MEKKIISDMHHRTTYMHSNFQQNRVSRSVKTVHTNLFAKKLQMAEICNLQLEFRKITPFEHAFHPLTDIQADFEINRLTRYQITAKRKY